jgi:PTS system glucose-specific IIC component
MFASPILYVAYAILTGIAFALADLIHLRVHAFGFIELLTRTPMMIKAGLGRDLINFVLVCIGFFALNFTVFKFLISKFNIPTPGRNGNEIEMEGEEQAIESSSNIKGNTTGNKEAIAIISLLGGQANIEDVDACMTRLRVTVKDPSLVASEKEWKSNGALGLIVKNNGVQAVYGPKADVLKSDIQDEMGA